MFHFWKKTVDKLLLKKLIKEAAGKSGYKSQMIKGMPLSLFTGKRYICIIAYWQQKIKFGLGRLGLVLCGCPLTCEPWEKLQAAFISGLSIGLTAKTICSESSRGNGLT
jgi:hypothetical protein